MSNVCWKISLYNWILCRCVYVHKVITINGFCLNQWLIFSWFVFPWKQLEVYIFVLLYFLRNFPVEKQHFICSEKLKSLSGFFSTFFWFFLIHLLFFFLSLSVPCFHGIFHSFFSVRFQRAYNFLAFIHVIKMYVQMHKKCADCRTNVTSRV